MLRRVGRYLDVYTGLHFRDFGHWTCGVVGCFLAESLGSSSRLRYRLCDSFPLIDRSVGDMFEGDPRLLLAHGGIDRACPSVGIRS